MTTLLDRIILLGTQLIHRSLALLLLELIRIMYPTL